MLNDCVPIFPFTSVTWIAKVYVAVAIGVPLITPVDVLRLKPEGSAPDETANA
jgi:hypothetical protein